MGAGGSTTSMGSSTSSAGERTAAAAEAARSVTCPLFYNNMPSKMVVPDGVLPHFDARRVMKGCAARVTMLREAVSAPLPPKTATTSPVATFLSTGGNNAHTIGVAEMCMSAPYLIAFTVDADGRLAPSDGESQRASTGNNNSNPNNNGSSAGIKGFNFKKNSAEEPKPRPTAKLPEEPSPHAAHANNNSNNTSTTRSPAPGHASASPSSAASSATGAEAIVLGRGSANAHPTTTPPAGGSGAGPSHPLPMAVRLSQGGDRRGRENPPNGHSSTVKSGQDTDTASTATGASVHSVLVKDSTLLTREGSMRKDAAENGSGRGPGLGLKKRSSKRLARLQVPHRTRYCFYNDSVTHEAQITFTVLYRVSDDPLRATRVMCNPTPHVAPTAGVRPSDSLNSASRTYVEVRENDPSLNPETFTALLRPPSTPEEKSAHDSIRPAEKGGAAAQVRLVLAPGATVAAIESSLLLGYHVQCNMVPFDDKKSLAVVGRYATAEDVQAAMTALKGTASAPDVEVALMKADKKNKSQDYAKNKPISLTLGFVTQYVREDTTDADGWSEAPGSAASHATTHPRAALERHLADVPYVTSGAGSSGPPSSQGPSLKASPQVRPAAPVSAATATPAGAVTHHHNVPSSVPASPHQPGSAPSSGVAPPPPPMMAPPRLSNLTERPNSRSRGPLVGVAPPLDVEDLSLSKLSNSGRGSSNGAVLAQPPSPTRSPLDRPPRLSTAPSSNPSSGMKRATAPTASSSSPVVAQRSLAASAAINAASAEGALPKIQHPSQRSCDSCPAVVGSTPNSKTGSKEVPATCGPTRIVVGRPQPARMLVGSEDTLVQSHPSLDDLGISF